MFIILSTYLNVPGDWQFFTRGAPNFQGGIFATSGAYIEPSTPPWATGAPVSFAFQYDADALPTPVASLYVGGDRIGMLVAAGNYAASPPNPLYIGREGPTVAKFLNGILRGLRFTLASRGYAESYTPPPGHAQRRRDAAGAGQRHHPVPRGAHSAHQPGAGVTHCRRAGVAGIGDALALRQPVDHRECGLGPKWSPTR